MNGATRTFFCVVVILVVVVVVIMKSNVRSRKALSEIEIIHFAQTKISPHLAANGNVKKKKKNKRMSAEGSSSSSSSERRSRKEMYDVWGFIKCHKQIPT